MNVLEKLAGNPTIANLAFSQIRKHIQKDGISMICIFVNNKGDIDAKEYTTPVIVIAQDEYLKLINRPKPNHEERGVIT